MGKYDLEDQVSDSDSDDDRLLDDIAALSAACLPSTNPNSSNAHDAAAGVDFSDDDDDDDDDLELLRSIKQQYGVGEDISHPLSLKPLTTLPPVDSDDEEDDFETLRAIQRRFSQYCDDATTSNGGEGGGVNGHDTEGKSENHDDKSITSDAPCMNPGDESLVGCRNDSDQGPCSTSDSGDPSSHASTFPKVAQTFVEAIKKNRSCQKFLRSKLMHIEARMEEIDALQKKVKILKGYQLRCKKLIGRALSQKQDARIQLISFHRQRSNVKGAEKNISPMCYGPVENSHVASYRAALSNFPLSFHREKWSDEERKNLQKGIRQQFQKRLIEKSTEFLSGLEEPGVVNGLDDIISSVRNFEITPEMIQDFAGKVNWEELASMYLPRRSGAECEARWLNDENSLINKDSWTPMEDKQLLLLIQHYGINNWSLVAEKLKTNRTSFQCLARYQRSLNASILKREWTEEEDAQLRSAVESFGESNWQVVASTLEGRTGTQCSNRWNKTLHPARQRVGKWSDDEDKRLRVAVTLFGQKNWYRIAQFVPGRTQVQCRERWVNVLDPSLNKGPWAEEEDLKLRKAIEEHGYCWSRIALSVPSRTDNQCRRRWKKLFPHEVPLLQAAKRIQKVALISNFVDRESERPALGPNDFVPLPIEGLINQPQNDDLPQKRNKSRRCRNPDSTRKAACCPLKSPRSRKHRKRAKSPEIEMIDDHVDVQSNNGKPLLTYKRRKTNKSGSKEMICNGTINVAAERNNLNEDQSRECRKRDRSPDAGMTSDVTDEGHSDGNNIMNCKTSAHKFGPKMKSKKSTRECRPKKRKCDGNTDIAKGCKKKSRESKTSDDTGDIETWDVPIRIWSRRARGVCSKKIAPSTMSGSNAALEENHDQHDKLTCSNSETKTHDDKEASIPRGLEDGSSLGDSATLAFNNAESHFEDVSKSSEAKFAKRRHGQSKLQSNRSQEWEDVPLVALLKKKGATHKQRKSSASFHRPLCVNQNET